jgi:hypothetical protein
MAVRTVWNVSIAAKLWLMAPCNRACWYSGKGFSYALRATLPSRTKIFITVTRCDLRSWNLYRSNGFFSFLRGIDHLWGTPSLIFKENRDHSRGWGRQYLKFTTYFPLVPRLRLSGTTGWKIKVSNPSTTKRYFCCANGPYLFWGPIQPPLQCLPGFFS